LAGGDKGVLGAQLRNLRGGAPDFMKAFSAIARTALAPKALDAKTKELIHGPLTGLDIVDSIV
jgi:alkylhydroperoxidase/carboxymuconolactone decarboxylase family protein YurZ